ncbi:MAG: hypothetical protein LBU39_01190 [Desulfobulbaceae bacterium]|jgi:MFS family permease|nr:hypothetical protein [Desulfobulbaceae bacterium]
MPETAPAVSLSPRAASVVPWLVAMSFFMQMLDTTILHTALPGMAQSLQVSPLKMRSLVVSMSMSVTIAAALLGEFTAFYAGPTGTTAGDTLARIFHATFLAAGFLVLISAFILS